jgi:[ribosomal protein S5]-alanine N-acetyltransferase
MHIFPTKEMNSQFPTIKTARFLLRQFNEADLEKVYTGLSDPHVIKYYGVHYTSLEETRKQIHWFTQLEKKGTGIWWAVCSPDNKSFYGAAGLNDLHEKDRRAEIGFWLLPQFWGQGIMGEVVPFVVEYGFHKLGLHRIEAFVETENLNCKKLMDKLDFTLEGTMIECEFKNDRWISLDIYATFNQNERGKTQ